MLHQSFLRAHAFIAHLGIIDGLSLGASVGSGVHGVLAKHAKFSGQTAISKWINMKY